MKKIIFFFILNLMPLHVFADENVMAFTYEEKESGTEPVNVRYLVNKLFLRIDDGVLQGDFLLFDRKNKIIYNVNQDDESILVIRPHKWLEPKFSFSVKEHKKILADAPEVEGKKILDYSKLADNKLCHRLQILPDVYHEELKAFIEYQDVLSGQQVRILHNTPKELHSPCLLVDQVYNAGSYYQIGLPIQEFHSRGYVKRLIDYRHIKVKAEWSVLPEGFKRYSISD